MYKIPIAKPSLPIWEDYILGLKKVWKSRLLSNFAEYSQKYEEVAVKYLGIKWVRVVGNADLGLILALSALDLKPNAEVITPSFTFNSTVNAVRWNGLKVVFADINKETWCLDPKDVEHKITPKTKAILATHIFGNPCKIEELRTLAKKYRLYLLFDSAHAYGSLYHGFKIGILGDIEVFSFSGTKEVTSGEGGIIVTKNEELYNKITLARNYGFMNDYNGVRLGLNGKISEMNAIMGWLNLPRIEEKISKRLILAGNYKKMLANVGDIDFQLIEKENRSVYKDFGILTNRRDSLAEFLEVKGIQTKKYFRPVHLMDYYKNEIKLPVTEKIANKCLCIPIYNEMIKEEQDYVIEKIIEFYKKTSH